MNKQAWDNAREGASLRESRYSGRLHGVIKFKKQKRKERQKNTTKTSTRLKHASVVTVLPQARAGATFQESRYSGRFHGVISAATPTGERWL